MAIGEVFKEITFEDVKIAVSVETEGNVTVRSKLKESVPTIPENVGKDFGFFLEITSDENVTNVYIEIFLGLGNDSIVPAAVDPKTIKLFYYDEETDTWVEIIDSTYDEKTGILSATIDHLTVFSQMSKKGGGGSTPGEEEGAGLENMMIYLVLIMVIIVILSIVGIVVKKRGKSREPVMDEVDCRAY